MTSKTIKTTRLSLSTSGVTPEFKKEYQELVKDSNLTHIEFVQMLIHTYKSFNKDFTKNELKTINQALEIAPTTYKKRFKKSVLRSAKSIINSNESNDEIDINNLHSTKAANKRADDLLESLFKHNKTVTNPDDKIFITKSSFLRFIEKAKEDGVITIAPSKTTANMCLERHNSKINKHHEELQLMANHNLKAYYKRLKNANKTEGKK